MDRPCRYRSGTCQLFSTNPHVKKDDMSEEVLDWKEAITRVLNKRELYVKLLEKFIETERDSAAKVKQALQNRDTETARQLVHSSKGAAANLGAKALAAAALELEMAIKAGVDTGPAINRFDSAVTDTLVTMSAFMSQ